MSAEAQLTRDVFISYSSQDKQWADAACAVLEGHRIRCWISPRDIAPGTEWGASIINGIDACRIMVLIFSAHANGSAQVRREVERAISKGLAVLPFRVENVLPAGAMEYALGNTHWLDGFTPPVERHLETLAESVNTLSAKFRSAVPTDGTPGLHHERVLPLPDPPAGRSRMPLYAGGAVAAVATALLTVLAVGGRPRADTEVATPSPSGRDIAPTPIAPEKSAPPKPAETKPAEPKPTPPKARRPVRSDFGRNDTNGWTTVNSRNQPGVTRPIVFDHAGEQWWLTATRVGSDPFFWAAPEKFLGDQSDRFGKWLVYYTFTRQPPPPDIRGQIYVDLRGAGGRLSVRGTDVQSRKNNFGWTVHSVRLNAAAGWQCSPRPGVSNEPATDAELKATLSGIKVLLIRGEYQTQPEGCIDMIEFGADEPPK